MKECPVETIVQKISGKYKMLILHRLGTLGTKRFNELCRLFPQATPRTMTRQLRELEQDGLITRKIYSEIPPKVEYSLSEQGRSLYPILQQLGDWEAEQQESQSASHTPQSYLS
ncbi:MULTISPECIES: helix-turn-helix domain-containing protein [Exiguobacterium]|uniref:winged helix-turn-helix transcriptional regulator n=1 Tax=Exiguobacterium TaxID=33986 RepID=UPI000877736E|nr:MULTISPECIES: helix-turn-helix domain-containing protein [Exiguobacterium]